MSKQEMIGQKFGRWTVIAAEQDDVAKVRCKCECGTVRLVRAADLTAGKSGSCGCLRSEKTTTHGMSGTRFYKIWQDMLQRCNNENIAAYPDYGGRGIAVCDRWHTFENFRDDMYAEYLRQAEALGEHRITIDRVDNDGNYTPENCRWATPIMQAQNKRGVPEHERELRELIQRFLELQEEVEEFLAAQAAGAVAAHG
ncbi:hypothetical protein [Numidum massiliense]|uniref:hypothetical protein n=1 Tax=Numidum massiliense TaxID=1522315 RepID=UPI0006D5B013|nr:hypothetical protein [Numidum massiliense]